MTDVFPGYDHITSCIGATGGRVSRRGDALLRHAEGARRPAEEGGREAGLHRLQDRRARGRRRPRHPGQRATGTTSSRKARAALNWQKHFELAFDGEHARALHDEDLDVDTDFCAMCGHDWCRVRISQGDRRVRQRQGRGLRARARDQEPGAQRRAARHAREARRASARGDPPSRQQDPAGRRRRTRARRRPATATSPLTKSHARFRSRSWSRCTRRTRALRPERAQPHWPLGMQRWPGAQLGPPQLHTGSETGTTQLDETGDPQDDWFNG